MMATATPENWGTAVDALFRDGSYDIVLASFITPFFVDCEGVARELVKVHEAHPETPFLVCLMTNPLWAGTKRILEEGGLPTYYFPESAARVAAALARVSELKARTEETAPALQVDSAAAAKILGGAPAGLLPAERAAELLRAYGIPVAAERFCEKAADLPAAAKALGWPVVLKGHVEGLTHKTEAGAVAVGLADEAALRAAVDRMSAKLGDGKVRWQLQEHVAGGTEVVLGAAAAGPLGHLVMFGLGGIFVEALKDVRFGLAPLTSAKADRLIAGLRHGDLLRGFRGAAAIDPARLRDLLLRVGRLVADHPRIVELDLNPVLAFADGARTKAVDVRIRLG
jgi:acetyltransferase